MKPKALGTEGGVEKAIEAPNQEANNIMTSPAAGSNESRPPNETNDNSSYDSNRSEDNESDGSSSSEDTHLDECDICDDGGDLICCDGCEKAYHAECLHVDADSLPDVWYGPCCRKRTSRGASSSNHVNNTVSIEKTEDKGLVDIDGNHVHVSADEARLGKSSKNAERVKPAAEKPSEVRASDPKPVARPSTEHELDRTKISEQGQFKAHNKNAEGALVKHHLPTGVYIPKDIAARTKPACTVQSTKSAENYQISTAQHKYLPEEGSNSTGTAAGLPKPSLPGITGAVGDSVECHIARPPPHCKQLTVEHDCGKCKQVQCTCKTNLSSNQIIAPKPACGNVSSNINASKSREQCTFRTVVVPPGVSEGSVFHVLLEEGKKIGAVCPKGVRPGQTMIVMEPGSHVVPIHPKEIVKMNEKLLMEGFDKKESEHVRIAFWEILFPRLQACGWSFRRVSEYNFGAYTFSSTLYRFESIKGILKFIQSIGMCTDAVKEFHERIEKLKDRKRKRLQDDLKELIQSEEKQVRIGSKYQARSLPRAGSYEPGTSDKYIHHQLWNRIDTSQDAPIALEYCTGEDHKKWNEWANHESFDDEFHKTIIESNKEMSLVSSTLKRPIGFCLWYYYSKYKPSEKYKILKSHMTMLQIEQTRNHDECTVCDEGGELLCCDTCSNAFHPRCIGLNSTSPLEDTWSCPTCVRKKTESCMSPAKSPKKPNVTRKLSQGLAEPQQLFTKSSTHKQSDPCSALSIQNNSFPPTNFHANLDHTRNTLNHSMYSQFGGAPSHPFVNQSDENTKSKYNYGDRYSLQNVAARKQDNGSVLPVGSLKQLSNGEYCRPIGRGRKGMEWDGVNGIWVPVSANQQQDGKLTKPQPQNADACS